MARTRKSIQPLNLYKYDVLIEDQGPRSDYFKISQFDGYFYGGRNAFLVAGAGALHPNSKILVEILNKNGNTVYSAPVTKFVEGNSRLVQVEVYEDTPIGPGKIVILGSVDTFIDGTPLPEEWRNKYNVRWITDVIISPLVQNKTQIRFANTPSVVVEEKFYRIPSSSLFTEKLTVPISVQLTPKYYNVFQNGYQIKITGSQDSRYFTEYTNGVITGSVFITGEDVAETATISLPVTKIFNSTLAESKGSLIYTDTKKLVIDGFISASGLYSSSIAPFGDVLATSSLNLQYSKLEAFDTGSSISYAKLRIVDAKTLSGEINKVRVSYKIATEPGEYVILSDVDVGVQQLLSVDSGSRIAETGKFNSIVINDYWYTATMSLQKNENTPTLPDYYQSSSLVGDSISLVQCCTDLLDAVNATPAIVDNKYIDDVSYFIGTRNENLVQVFPRSEYTLTFDAIVSRNSSSVELIQDDYSLEVYLVSQEGSATKLIQTDNRGQLLGTLTPSDTFTKQNFEDTQFNFIPKILETGKFGIRFIAYGGHWSIANVSLKTAEEPFFSPDEIDILVPNVSYTDKILSYKIQYLDVNNNSVSISTISTPTYFTGSDATAIGVISNAVTSSYAATASFVQHQNPGNNRVITSLDSGSLTGESNLQFDGNTLSVTGSLVVSGSATLRNIGPAQFTGSVSVTAGITGSLLGTATTASYVSSSALTNQNVTFGTVSASSVTVQGNFTVLGSSSVQYVTSSQLNIGTNIITVNVQNPSPRFGGLAVIDSGSSPQRSGSLLFDSLNDQWIFVHQNQTSPTSSILLMGPQTYNNIGNETSLTNNYLIKSVNAEHVSSSQVYDNGTNVGIGISSPAEKLEISGSIKGIGAETNLYNFKNVTGRTSDNLLHVAGGINLNGTLYLNYNGGSVSVGASTAATFAVNTNGLYVNTSNNVGIGITSPITKLHVNDGSGRNFLVTSDAAQQGTAGIAIGSFNDNASSYAILSIVSSKTIFNSNVGIGTTNPGSTLHVQGTVSASTFIGSLTGNASTVTNGVYTNGSYSDPTWITSLAGSKISGNITGNAANITAYTINQNLGTSNGPTFDGITSTSTILMPTAYVRGAASNSGVIIIQSNAGSGTAHWITSKTNGVLHIGGSGATEPSVGAIVVNSANNFIGIGTDNPLQLLHLSSTGTAKLKITADTDNVTETELGGIEISQDGGITTAYFGHDDGNNLILGVNSTTSPAIYIGTRNDGTNFVTSSDAKVTITNGGNVGIGTISPSNKLHVYNSSVGAIAQFEGGSGRYIYTGTDGGGHYIEQIGTSAGERVLRIQNSNGSGTYTQLFLDGANQRIYTSANINVGIGTTSPSNKLDVIGNMLVQGTQGFNATSETATIYIGNSDSYIQAVYDGGMDFYQNNTFRMRIQGSTGYVGIGTSSPTSLLHISGVGQRAGLQINAVKTYVTERLSASATQARRFEIARIGIDYNDWNQVGVFMVELFEYYYSRGLYKRYHVSYGYNNNSYRCDLIENVGSGDNNYQVTVGSPVAVSGDEYYLPVYVEVRYYGQCDVRITTNRTITTSTTPGIGYTYINLNPTPSNISDFTADSQVVLAANAGAYIAGSVGIGTTSPGRKLDVVGRTRLRSDGSTSAGTWYADSSGNEDIFVGQTGTTYTNDWGVWTNSSWRFTIRRSDGIIYLNGKQAFRSDDTYLRINEGGEFSNGIWMASTNMAAGTGYWSLGSNGGTTTSRIYMYGGTYDGTNVIYLNGSNGNAYFAGNVGIGTTSPTTALTVAGVISGSSTIETRAITGRTALGSGAGGSITLYSGSTLVAAIETPSAGGGAYIRDKSNQNIQFTSNSDSITTLFIAAAGNIGINNSNPVAKLHIEGGSANWNETTPGSSNGTIHLDPGVTTDNFGNAITFGASDTGNGENAQAGIYVRSDGSYGTKMYLATTDAYISGAKTRLMIDSNGRVGIGNTSPATALHVTGEIVATSEITAYYSDARLKTITGKIENALDKIHHLSGYYYVSNEKAAELGFDANKPQIGVIAQEVEEILPELVTLAPFDMVRDENDVLISKTGENYKTVKYEKLVPVLIEAIKEQQTLIRQLQEKVDQLYKI